MNNKFYSGSTGNYWYDWEGTGVYDIDGSVNNFDPYPMHVDLDQDNMPDSWEVDNGLDPLVDDSAEDLDCDGLPNIDEYSSDTDPLDSDTDGDGLIDGDEVNIYFTSPLDSDTDGDDLTDDDEVNIYFTSPLDNDTDNDGLTDGDEVNIYYADPNDSDTDSDGMPDGWEVSYSLNPLVDDSSLDPDGDGLTNLQEYSSGTDPNASDTDDDGLTDGDEVNIYSTDPLVSDTDHDGMADGWEVDNNLNPLTKDSSYDNDDDMLSNYYEYIYHTDPNDADTDDDELNDYSEVMVFHTDPLDSDTDNDDLTDGEEVNIYSTNPKKSDSDNDGVPDGEEVNVYGTDPNNSDTDSDGISDGEEIAQGKNPKTPSFIVSLVLLFGNQFNIIIAGVGITVVFVVIVLLVIIKKRKRKEQKEIKKKRISKRRKSLLKIFNDTLNSIENDWLLIEKNQELVQTLFNLEYSEKISELFVNAINLLIDFNSSFTINIRYLSSPDWLDLKKRLNTLLDKYRNFLLRELEEIDINEKYNEITEELKKVTLENIENFSEEKLLQPLNVLLDALVKIEKYIRETESFIDEFTFSKLSSYWGKLSDIIVKVKSEVKNKRSEIRKNIKELKEVFTDKKMNLERLEKLNKVSSVYKQIPLSKLAYLLKFSSDSALIYWLSNQNLDFSYIIADDEIIFEKQEEGKEEIKYDIEMTNAIDSLLRQYDEWSKGDKGKKI
ncbi:MAG: hypothetical protein ACTSSL_06650 [Candidatus Heimdallarchaeaceae archaeon]